MTTPTYTISYTYDDSDIVGTEADLLPVKQSSGSWYMPTGATFTTGTEEGTGSVNTGTNTLTWSGLSTFSLYGGAGDAASPLPVDLISFEGLKSNNFNNLIWKTASEKNNSHFILEKSEDGKQFDQITTVLGAGTTYLPVNYIYDDYKILPVINYYRLSQFDYDGKKETFKKIVSIDNRSYGDKKIVARYNVLGQSVNEDYKGVVILLFSDGTSEKILQ